MGKKASAKPAQEVQGIVKSYNATNRYGFVVPMSGTEGSDIFVDGKCVKDSGLEFLKTGARVVCECVRRDRGTKARRVRLVEV